MKFLLTTFFFLQIVSISFSQSEAERRMKAERESLPYRESSEIPQSFIIVSNFNNTFIKDSVNYVQAVAHGYHDTELVGVNCSVKRQKNTNTYEVTGFSSDNCQISINGVNTTTRKKVCIGVYIYVVVDKVLHTIIINESVSGETIDEESNAISWSNVHYYDYDESKELIEWTMESGGKTISGKGEILDQFAQDWIRNLASGAPIVVKGKAKSNFQGEFEVTSVFLKK